VEIIPVLRYYFFMSGRYVSELYPQDPSFATGNLGKSQQEFLDPNIHAILAEYPFIALLNDAPSYPRETETHAYSDMSGEELRTAKSIATLRRSYNGDEAGLLGPGAEQLQPGYQVYRGIIERGVRELGGGDVELGTARMAAILAVHDLAKSRAVAAIAEQTYGVTDHDMALPALVQDNFAALNGHAAPYLLDQLQGMLDTDPRLHAFFDRQRGIDPAFNVGRHLQGESDFTLFRNTVYEVSQPSMAEFVLDLLGGDGHQSPDGPVKFYNIPPAFNGIAAGLAKIMEAAGQQTRQDDGLYALWEEVSYPTEDLSRLGLRRSTDTNRAITRIAFMGREHQQSDSLEARANVEILQGIVENMENEARDSVKAMLQDTQGLDLGFTPHVMDALRRQLGTEAAYVSLLTILSQIAKSEAVVQKAPGVLTINLDNKFDWSSIDSGDSINVLMSRPDSSGVINAKFEVAPKA